ncbi:MAG: ABC transporter permease [Clostridiaceae bacterium]|nr:ABC transporter permease [Clostridiaceae bacterium]
MRFADTIVSAAKEFRLGKNILIPGVVVATMLISVSIILINMTISVIPAMYEWSESQDLRGVYAIFHHSKLEDVDLLREKGVRNLSVEVYPSTILDRSTLSFAHNEVQIPARVIPVWLSRQSMDGYSGLPTIVSERILTNGIDQAAYIFCPKEDFSKFEILDSVDIISADGISFGKYYIQGIASEIDGVPCETVTMYVSFEVINPFLLAEGIRIPHEIYGWVDEIALYQKLQTELKSDYDIYIESPLDSLIQSLGVFKLFFMSASLLMLFISTVGIYSISGMFFNSRRRNIATYKMLGTKDKYLLRIQFIVMEITLVTAVAFAMIVVRFSNRYIREALNTLTYGIQYRDKSIVLSAIIAWFIMNIMLWISSILMIRKISRIRIVEVLRDKE